MDSIVVKFLRQNGQTGESVAQQLADFIGGATRTVDIAIYDFHLTGPTAQIVGDAIRARRQAGVAVRVAYDHGRLPADSDEMIVDEAQGNATAAFVASLGVPARAIGDAAHPEPKLMHQKYVIVDAYTPVARVCTGSGNYTDDTWTAQENNLLFLSSADLANYYAQDFQELWARGDIGSSGALDFGDVTLTYAGESANVRVMFSPGRGQQIDAYVATCLGGARRQVVLGSGIITSSHVLGALGELMQRGIPISGVYDKTQMDGVMAQWADPVGRGEWKIALFKQLVAYGGLHGKQSTPFDPQGSVHDFMHNKVMVVDDRVITGSYNFSRSAEMNAENILFIDSSALASSYCNYIRDLAQQF